MPIYTPPITRRNFGRGHGYRDAHGQKVPGVTTIIGDGVPKPALVAWAANTTAEYAMDHWDELADLKPSERLKRLTKARYEDRDAAARRGTEVHALAEKLVHGEQVAVPDELAGHVEAYVQFLDDWDVAPILVEFVIVSHRYGYAGTADAIVEMHHPELPGQRIRALLDVKTSRSGVFGETALQLAAYRYADVHVDPGGTEHAMVDVEFTGVIHVRADGYSLVPVTAGPDQFRAFRYAQQIKSFCDESSELVQEAITPPLRTESVEP